MITIEKLKKYAELLMFEMSDEEYLTLQNEFDVVLKQMELIEEIDGISDIQPMTFPYVSYTAVLRKDEATNNISTEEVLMNTEYKYNDQVKVPKVVE